MSAGDASAEWAAEQMPNIPDPVAEAALAHKVPDAVVKAYKRTTFLDMRRKLMAAWSDHLLGKPAKQNSEATQSEGNRMAG